MLIISHRGNIDGPDSTLENNPIHIKQLLDRGVNVEVDVRCTNGQLWLGHDNLVNAIDSDFLRHHCIWAHAKNVEALTIMLSLGIHCFWHEEDHYTLTSRNFIWTHPKVDLSVLSQSTLNRIIVVSNDKQINHKVYGICTDYLIHL